jgi:polygalacturonase
MLCVASVLGVIGAQANAQQQTVCPLDPAVTANADHPETQAIQSTLDRCAAAGGGVVSLSDGVYLSGPLALRSGVTLHLSRGAILRASNVEGQFQAAFIGTPSHAGEAFILANHVKDVAIDGEGTIDGSGAQLWWSEARRMHDDIRSGKTDVFTRRFPNVPLENGLPRPWLVEFNDVSNGKVGAVTLTNSPMWNLVLKQSKQVLVKGTTIVNPADSRNTDGVDIVSSQAVTLSGVDISTGDDDVAIKSGLPKYASSSGPCSDITVQDSTIRAGHGLSIGSETANDISNISFKNIHFLGTENGVRIKSARDRGSRINGIHIASITMRDVSTPIIIDDEYGGQAGTSHSGSKIAAIPFAAVTSTTPFIDDIHIDDLKADGAKTAAVIFGLPEAPIRRLHVSNTEIQSVQGMKIAYVHDSAFEHVHIASATPPVEEGPEVRNVAFDDAK